MDIINFILCFSLRLILKTSTATLPNYLLLKQISEYAYQNVEDYAIAWENHKLGVLTLESESVTTGANPHRCSVIKLLDCTYHLDAHKPIVLVIVPTSIPDSSAQSKSGSAFDARNILFRAAVELAAQDVISMGIKRVHHELDDLPEYLHLFIISPELRSPAEQKEYVSSAVHNDRKFMPNSS